MSRMNYDPNIRTKMTVQTVELTLQQWRYKTTLVVDVSTNATGADVIDMAIEKAWESLPTDDCEDAYVKLSYRKNILTCSQDEDRPSDANWLREMVVGARITLNGKARP